MSDRNNRDINQDYLELLGEYARKEQEEREKKEKIDVDFYNNEAEISSIEEGNLKTRVDLSVFDDEKPLTRKVSAPPMVKVREPKEKNPFKRFGKWFKKLSTVKKVLFSILAVILAILIALFGAGGVFVAQKLSLLGTSFGDEDDDVIYEEQDFADIEIDIGSAGFKQSLIDWATIGNDKKMSSKNVINVLLIGADSRKGKNEGNTDVMMLISVNKKTKELKLVSFFRDSYLYVEGNKNSYCTKLNAAYSMGGPETLIQTIENNYKIEIDNYVMVNFESFTEIIDAMGGVTVDVQQYEADYNYKKFKVELPVGEDVTLNGEQALCFVRIRNCDADGDVSRTRRQRMVIDSILSRVKSASISDLNKYIDLLLPYVDTGYKKTEIVSMGIKALTGGWANYERKQLQMPPEDCRTSGSANMWIWVVDYELAAHKLQMELYGQSNIVIAEDRVSIIDVYRGANYTGTSNSDSNSAEVVTTTNPVITTEPQTNEVSVSENNQPTEDVSEEYSENLEVSDDINDTPTEENTEEIVVPPETEPVTTPPETEVLV
jgi:LCP family protein required for cell wall assembly